MKAFAASYRVLKPASLFLFTTGDKLENNTASRSSRSIAKKYLGKLLPESYNVATPVSDEAVITLSLQDAGIAKLSIEKAGIFSVSDVSKLNIDCIETAQYKLGN